MKFEGRFLDSVKNGNIKEYDNDGKLIFEGEYKDGKKYGYGEEYYKDGKLKFKGGYWNGIKWNGIEYFYNNNNKKSVYRYKEGIFSISGIIKPYGFYLSGIIKGTNKEEENNNK